MNRQGAPEPAPAATTGLWIAALLSAAALASFAVSAPGQDRVSASAKQWRPVPSGPQRHSGPSLPPPIRSASAQVAYEESPYVGEFVPQHDPALYDSGVADCHLQHCGCGQQACCSPQMSYQRPFACGYWISGEYLLWGISGSDLPPLVTTSVAGTAPADTGILGRAGTSVLVGSDASDWVGSGFRIAGGWWLDRGRRAAVELEYANLPRQSERDSFDSLNFPLLARPVFDTMAGAEAAMLVAHPNLLTGNVSVETAAEFHLAGAFRRDRISETRCRNVDSIIGFRFASLEEDLRIDQTSQFPVGTGQIIAGTTLDLFDRFETRNRFYGVTLGLDAREQMGAWTLQARGLLSFGPTRAESLIDGATVTTVPGGGSATAIGGLLAQQTNIGRTERDRFAVLPEFTVGMSTHLNRCWHVGVGYHLLYWSDAVRPGGLIDRQVSQFPPEPPSGTLNPGPRLSTRGVLVHGLQTGVTYQF